MNFIDQTDILYRFLQELPWYTILNLCKTDKRYRSYCSDVHIQTMIKRKKEEWTLDLKRELVNLSLEYLNEDPRQNFVGFLLDPPVDDVSLIHVKILDDSNMSIKTLGNQELIHTNVDVPTPVYSLLSVINYKRELVPQFLESYISNLVEISFFPTPVLNSNLQDIITMIDKSDLYGEGYHISVIDVHHQIDRLSSILLNEPLSSLFVY